MKSLLTIIFTIFFSLIFAQQEKVVYYDYGYDGIEIISKADSTTIYSNFNARPEIRREVANYIVANYRKIKPGFLIVKIDGVVIEGRFEILRHGTLICLNYYYQKVSYKDGKIMIYKKPLKSN